MAPTETTTGHDLPFARDLFEACDRLRGSVESAEYKHLVLGLLFLKYISDSFERQRNRLDEATRDPGSELYAASDEEREEILEDRDEYLAANVFWVSEKARWEQLLAAASQPDIGQRIDAALEAIERDNVEELRGVLPRVYARSHLAPAKMGELVNVIARIGFGEDDETARDILGRTYEYFIKTFARAEGHRGGEFFTPRSVVRLLVEMLEPYQGRVFDPACGSCGMFIQSSEFVTAHGGRPQEISIYGQEMAITNWRIGRMNLAIHGLSGAIKGGESSLTNDLHPGLRAEFVLANPPFNQKGWGAAEVVGDARWRYGPPPDQNANFAWIQHFVTHLAPDGRAGFVMANGSLSSTSNGEGNIREAIVRDDLVDCVVALPPQMFFTTPIPVCLWFLDRSKGGVGERKREGETLFIDARTMGRRITRTQVELTSSEAQRIVSVYRTWRTGVGTYEDVPGLHKRARLADIEQQSFNLNPGRYVGVEQEQMRPEAEVAEEIETLVRDFRRLTDENAALALRLSDRFGDLGYA